MALSSRTLNWRCHRLCCTRSWRRRERSLLHPRAPVPLPLLGYSVGLLDSAERNPDPNSAAAQLAAPAPRCSASGRPSHAPSRDGSMGPAAHCFRLQYDALPLRVVSNPPTPRIGSARPFPAPRLRLRELLQTRPCPLRPPPPPPARLRLAPAAVRPLRLDRRRARCPRPAPPPERQPTGSPAPCPPSAPGCSAPSRLRYSAECPCRLAPRCRPCRLVRAPGRLLPRLLPTPPRGILRLRASWLAASRQSEAGCAPRRLAPAMAASRLGRGLRWPAAQKTEKGGRLEEAGCSTEEKKQKKKRSGSPRGAGVGQKEKKRRADCPLAGWRKVRPGAQPAD
nr:serine/arginine repetitive matrix protein 1-like [Aegilops tauschii subsp. strangulata]